MIYIFHFYSCIDKLFKINLAIFCEYEIAIDARSYLAGENGANPVWRVTKKSVIVKAGSITELKTLFQLFNVLTAPFCVTICQIYIVRKIW